MQTTDFATVLLVDITPMKAFDAINDVKAWWTEEVEGSSTKLNDEFTVHFFDDLHVSTQKLVEVAPGKKVVWLVTKSRLNFLENKSEWTGTRINFEIHEKGKKTEVRVTHEGLVPEVECYDACVGGWHRYLEGSLLHLMKDGKGKPELNSKTNV